MSHPPDSSSSAARIGIVDPRVIVRQLLARTLSTDPRLSVTRVFSAWSDVPDTIRADVAVWVSPHVPPWVGTPSIQVEDFDVSRSEPLCDRVFAAARQPFVTSGGAPDSPFRPLSRHEQAVLEATAQGLTAGAIAAALDVSVRSVETARRRVMQKFEVNSAAEAVRRFHDLRSGNHIGSSTPTAET